MNVPICFYCKVVLVLFSVSFFKKFKFRREWRFSFVTAVQIRVSPTGSRGIECTNIETINF